MMQKFTGIQYLKIDIANSYGHDKLNWEERIKWTEVHEDELEELVTQAKDPAMYYAGVQAYRKAQLGQPSGYPISLDATSSGLQILAALTGDRRAAELCNVVDTGQREDAYTGVYQRMVSNLIDMGLPTGNIDRDDVKQAVMTSLYGSKAVPEEVFGKGAQLNVFYRVMTDVAPAAWELNQAFLDLWDSEALINSWVLPDNFHVHVKVMQQVEDVVQFLNQPYRTFHKINAPIEEGRSLGANTIHSIDGMIVREMVRRCDYNVDTVLRVTGVLGNFSYEDDLKCNHAKDSDTVLMRTLWEHYERTGYLSARILDHIYPQNVGLVDRRVIWELIESLPDEPFKIMAVHDCFRVLPNHGNDLRTQYNHQLMLVAKSNLLQDLLSQLVSRPLQIGKLDETLWRDVAFTNYALS